MSTKSTSFKIIDVIHNDGGDGREYFLIVVDVSVPGSEKHREEILADVASNNSPHQWLELRRSSVNSPSKGFFAEWAPGGGSILAVTLDSGFDKRLRQAEEVDEDFYAEDFLSDIEGKATEIWEKGDVTEMRGNPADTVNVEQARQTLNSMLADYDRRVSARERMPNIYRIGHLLGASDRVFEGLGTDVPIAVLEKRTQRFFIVNDLPPAKKFLELLKKQPETPPSGIYLAGWPKTPAKRKSKKSTNPRTKTMANKKKTHKDVKFAVGTDYFDTAEEAAVIAVARGMSNGKPQTLDVVVGSKAGARWYGGDHGVDVYEEDPEASVHERIIVRAESQGRIA